MKRPNQCFIVEFNKVKPLYKLPVVFRYVFSKPPSATDISNAVDQFNNYYTDYLQQHVISKEISEKLKSADISDMSSGWTRFITLENGDSYITMCTQTDFF